MDCAMNFPTYDQLPKRDTAALLLALLAFDDGDDPDHARPRLDLLLCGSLSSGIREQESRSIVCDRGRFSV